jgi:hypothetical protein
MNVLCSAAKTDFWLDVFYELEGALRPVYWVGTGVHNKESESFYFHNVWDAFSLQGCVPGWEMQTKPLDMSWVSRVEYYNYLKILDRVDGGGFSFSERDDLFKRQLDYWSYVLEVFSVDLVFFSNAPHLPYDYPLYLCAKRKGIKTLMFNVSSIACWHYLTRSIGSEPYSSRFITNNPEFLEKLKDEAVENFLFDKHEKPWYMEAQSKKQKSLPLFLERNPFTAYFYNYFKPLARIFLRRVGFKSAFSIGGKYQSIKFYQGLYGKHRVGVRDLSSMLVSEERKKNRLKKEYQQFSKNVNFENRYVYFPLHYQPELTTTPLGNEASDQIYVIRELSKALPNGVELLVKEHPSQHARVLHGGQGRFLGCWECVSQLPNVTLCDPDISSISLVKNAEAVVTITGTAGWEAIVNKKASLHFGGAWYQFFPQAKKLDFEHMASQLKCALDFKEVSPVEENELIHFFGDLAINADIHGVAKKQSRNDVLITAKYLELSLNSIAS